MAEEGPRRVGPPVIEKTPGSGLVGRRTRALLAPRVTGQVRYTDDIHLPRMLWGASSAARTRTRASCGSTPRGPWRARASSR